jgi:endonuclease YncB( thermonuclease family)
VTPRLFLTLLAVAVTAAGCSSQAGSVTTATFPVVPDVSTVPRPQAAVEIDVQYVLDGDSLEAVVDGETVEIRLLGVNAPERGECWSDRARSALEGLLAAGPVWLQDAGGTDRFGRILGYLFTPESFVNRSRLEDGDAIALTVDHPELAEFLATEEEAFRSGRGWWAADACGPSGPFNVAITAADYDAPGPDDENLNGERIVVANRGSDIDVGGWVLRDESSSHRYRFPIGTTIPAGGTVVIRTGCGDDRDGEYYWCAGGSVWSNGGDTVLLLDDLGNVVDRYRYTG